jgi:hypothetical protein
MMEQPEVVAQDSDADIQTAPETEPEVVEIDADLIEDDQQPDEDEIDDELDGVKVRGKKEAIEKLRNERLMQADYTRKRQAQIAEFEAKEKAVAARDQEVQARGQLYQAHLTVVAELVGIDKQLAAFQQIDFNALTDSDPVQAMKLDRQYRNLLEQKQKGMQNLSVLQQQHALDQQRKEAEKAQTTAKRLEEAAQVLQREVPNWSKRDSQLLDYAIKQGFKPDAITSLVLDAPQIGKVLHKAELYDQLVAKQKSKVAPEPQAEPVTRIASTRAVSVT